MATDNIEAMTRSGYARGSEVIFDAHEAAVWSSIGLAMAEKVTGVRATAEVQDVKSKANWYVVPMPWGAMEDY